nr:MAG TPA: Major capsid protein [Caudoviricetes sp.]
MYTFELNNERKDANFASGRVSTKSPVVEIFSAMRDGKDLAPFGRKADQAANYIKELNSKASAGDLSAVSELNEIRRFSMEPQILQEAKLLSIYGNYKAIGYNDSCEVEIPEFVGNPANKQALGQDVNFPVIRKKRTPIATVAISAGYAVDYRKAAIGDMSDENELKNQIAIQIRNKAAAYVVETIYKAIKHADGVKYFFEGDGLTKTGVDGVITPVRRFGKPTITGDYALVSQLNAFAGYQGTTPAVTGISEAVMKEIHDTGLMGMYNGAVVSELPNPYDTSLMNADGTDFQTVLPQGLGYVIPAGGQSPIYTVTRGGLTSISGTDVSTGQLITRYDLEVGALVAPGREYMIGLLGDKKLSTELGTY